MVKMRWRGDVYDGLRQAAAAADCYAVAAFICCRYFCFDFRAADEESTGIYSCHTATRYMLMKFAP